MNHRPFEDWLLEDQPITSEQQRDLQAHLRVCTSCSAIAESNLALHSTRQVLPAAGFTERFQSRLVQRRREQRWRQVIGSLVLVLGGLGILYWVAGPAVEAMLRSPAEWITAAVGYGLFILTSIQALGEVGWVLLHVIPDFISPFGWTVLLFSVSALTIVWMASMARFARSLQGV